MLIVVLSVYVALALLVMLVQRRLIYFPTQFAEQVGIEVARKQGFEPWRNAEGNLIGWHLPARSVSAGSVLIVHGNAGSAVDRKYMAGPIHAAASLDVYILEYPGYGARAGSPTMGSLLDAGEEAFRMLPTNVPAYLVAESLGTGVAAHLAKLFPDRVSGLTLFVPYNKFTAVAQTQMRWLPAGLLLRDRFNPSEWLKDYRGPIHFVVAADDTIIPARLGKRLHGGYPGPKRLELVPGAGHNDVAAQPVEWWRETLSFLRHGK